MGFAEVMGAITPMLGGITSSTIGGIANRRSQRRQMKFNNAEAVRARDFQEKMFYEQERLSNSAYQRSTADMKAAGLNPLMMYGGGGGAQSNTMGAPSSASASMSPQQFDFSAIEKGISKSATTALELRSLRRQEQKVNSEIGLINTQKDLTKAQAKIADQNVEANSAQRAKEIKKNRIDKKFQKLDSTMERIKKAAEIFRQLKPGK